MKHIAACALALLITPAAAQQLTAEQSVAAQLGQQVGLCMHASAVQQHQLQDMQSQLAQATAKIKALEDKYEPKTPAK